MLKNLINANMIIDQLSKGFVPLAQKLKPEFSVTMSPSKEEDDGDIITPIFKVNFAFHASRSINFDLWVLFDPVACELMTELILCETPITGEITPLIKALKVVGDMQKAIIKYNENFLIHTPSIPDEITLV